MLHIFISILLFILSKSAQKCVEKIGENFSPRFFIVCVFKKNDLVHSVIRVEAFFQKFIEHFGAFKNHLFKLVTVTRIDVEVRHVFNNFCRKIFRPFLSCVTEKCRRKHTCIAEFFRVFKSRKKMT